MRSTEYFLPRAGSKLKKAGVGDIHQIPLPDRYAYVQIAYIEPSRGASMPIVRIFRTQPKQAVKNINALIDSPQLYYIQVFRFGIGNRAKWFPKIGTLPLPVCWKERPSFRSKHIVPDADGRYLWRIRASTHNGSLSFKNSSELTDSERDLPDDGAISPELLVIRLATAWTPRKEIKERFNQVSLAERKFLRKYPDFESRFDWYMRNEWGRKNARLRK